MGRVAFTRPWQTPEGLGAGLEAEGPQPYFRGGNGGPGRLWELSEDTALGSGAAAASTWPGAPSGACSLSGLTFLRPGGLGGVRPPMKCQRWVPDRRREN